MNTAPHAPAPPSRVTDSMCSYQLYVGVVFDANGMLLERRPPPTASAPTSCAHSRHPNRGHIDLHNTGLMQSDLHYATGLLPPPRTGMYMNTLQLTALTVIAVEMLAILAALCWPQRGGSARRRPMTLDRLRRREHGVHR